MDQPIPAGAEADTDTPETASDRLEIIMGKDGVARLEASRVLVLGCGGVGSSCVEALARGRVGTLAVVDKDVVAPSNINRQAIAFTSTVGRRKIDVMAAMISDINPACTVIARDAFVLPDNLEATIDAVRDACGGELDCIVDAIDTVSTKIALAELAERRGWRLISSMGAANKLMPDALRIADIYETSRDALSRIVRKECRRRGVRHLTVLYSTEEAVCHVPRQPDGSRGTLGTASYMPPIMGQMIAGWVIRQLSGVGADATPTE